MIVRLVLLLAVLLSGLSISVSPSYASPGKQTPPQIASAQQTTSSASTLPDFKMPYAYNEQVGLTGGPHGYIQGGQLSATIPTGDGSGLDFASVTNPHFNVLAMADGTVEEASCADQNVTGFGCIVAIRHDVGGTFMIYAHLDPDTLTVSKTTPRTHVTQGQVIAKAGNSGNQPFIHLHIELRDGSDTCTDQPECLGNGLGGNPMEWGDLVPLVDGWRIGSYLADGDGLYEYNYDGSAVKGNVKILTDFWYNDNGTMRNPAAVRVSEDFFCTFPGDRTKDCEVYNNGSPNTRFARDSGKGTTFPGNLNGAGDLSSTNVPRTAVREAAGFTANSVPNCDDCFVGPVALPFTLNFFGNSYGSLYVNNNGNVTFDQGLSTFTPFGLQGAGRPIIAPFFGDVWTNGTPAVTYGVDTVDGHQAFGVDWFNVGYFTGTEKRNTFQLILINRSDRGQGDFDIEFNYGQIQWETGSASGGSGGLGGDSAHVGYSNGTNTSFELPGSGVPGSFLDTGASPLISQSSQNQLNDIVPGRLIFPVTNGSAPTGGTISGTVYANSVAPANALAGAFLQACGSGGNCLTSSTNASGFYQFTGLPSGTYTITAFPPGNSALLQASVGNLAISGGNTIGGQNIILTGPQPLPNGTTITNRGVGSDGIPIIYWQSPETLTTTGCAGGTATYQVTLAAGSTNPGSVIASGPMTESPAGSGNYTASFPAVYPNHGNAAVSMTINCPNAGAVTATFSIYIDPSGKVVDQNNNPIPGATVTLYRSDTADGTFSLVPDGSGIMSVANRNNPDTTDQNGLFGWDVVAGYYQVQASAPGCSDPNNSANAYVTSPVLTIPPAVTNLTLQLNCPDIVPPITQATLTPAPNAAGWNNGPVAVTLNATDNQGGAGVRSITYSATGAQPIASATVNAATATLPTISAAGVTPLSFAATDNANNAEATTTLPVRIDPTAPTCNISVVAGPPKQAIAAVQDGGSGLASIQVTESNNATSAIAPFSVGTTQPVNVTFTKVDQSLGAQFALIATDQAGNSVTCDPADVTVDRTTGKPVPTTITGIHDYERTVTIQNGTPGLTNLDVAVNGKHVSVARLADGATTTLDIGSTLKPGANNTVVLTPKGKPGGSSTVLVWGASSSIANGSAVVKGTSQFKKPAPNKNVPTEIDRRGAPLGRKAK